MPGAPIVLKFPRGLPPSKQFGERLRLLVVDGKDKGTCFSLIGDLIFIGRSDTQIVLNDQSLSKKHAEISWAGDHYKIRDLGSSNGITYNNNKVSEAKLSPGDIFLMGLTVIEVYAAGQTRRNEAPIIPGTGKKKPGAQPKLTTEEEKKKKEVDKKRMIVYVILFFIGYLAFFSGEDTPKTNRENAFITSDEDAPTDKKGKKLSKKDIKGALSEYIPNYDIETQQRKDAEIFFRTGMREYQNKNYRRAMTAFETALTVDPTHDQAKIYLRATKDQMANEVFAMHDAGYAAFSSLRYKEARMHFENVVRYMESDAMGDKILIDESARKRRGKSGAVEKFTISDALKKSKELLEKIDKEEKRLK